MFCLLNKKVVKKVEAVKSIFFVLVGVFIVSFLFFVRVLDGSTIVPRNTVMAATPSQVTSCNTKEMKAVWVPFMALNMNGTDYSENSFKQKYDRIVEDCKKLKINTLVVHVRAFSDAVYPSKYFPWSHLVSKNQGENPGYDPLKYMIQKTHEAGMEFHAWLNPYRIQYNNVPNTISLNNPYSGFKSRENTFLNENFVDFGKAKYYNPASKEAQDLVVNGVREIVENYDVDGIHFDDYFYPDPLDPALKGKGADIFDEGSYEFYKKSLKNGQQLLNLAAWRVENVNKLVKRVYSEIKSINPNVVFGISPSCYNKLNERISADVFTWCKDKGYIDYICPQVYVSLEHPWLPFEKAVNIWKNIERDPSVKLYYGIAVYKSGLPDYDKGTWSHNTDILKKQIEHIRKAGCDGYVLFDYDSLVNEVSKERKEEINNLKEVL